MPAAAEPRAYEMEVDKAVEWLASALLPSDSPDSAAFADALRDTLGGRYEGHWYVGEPHRGCAYRSLTCNAACGLDPLVNAAAHQAKAQPELQGDGFILWCNPGEVKALLDTGVRKCIYQTGKKAANPYSKARVNIEPTRLNVVAETSSSAASSRANSVNSSPKAAPALSPFAMEFAPVAARSDASESESDSETETGSQAQPPLPAGPPPPGLLVKPPPGALPMPLLGMPPLPPPHQQQGWPAPGGSWYPAYGVEAY